VFRARVCRLCGECRYVALAVLLERRRLRPDSMMHALAPPEASPPRRIASIAAVAPRDIHHLGVAVTDLEEALATYVRLFAAELEHRATVPDQGVEAASLRLGEGRIELLRPLGMDTPVGRFLAKRGPGMHHVAYEVDDLSGELAQLAREGAELIDAEPHRGLFGLQVAFVHPDAVHGVLTELVTNG
jgi:methylmalonyl-CoA/ethylmalonyl-CoA epimerase